MGPASNLWSKWKALRLPWRKHFLVGADLAGNTYWEFKPTLNATRHRRIVKTNPKAHLGDVQVTPQWHQWLRYVRPNPPSIQEQRLDVTRQEQVKHLARLADERWASKPSYLDKPQSHQPAPAMRTSDETLNPSPQHAPDESSPGVSNAVKSEEEDAAAGAGQGTGQGQDQSQEKQTKKEDPWARAKGPSENWQPEPWAPSAARR